MSKISFKKVSQKEILKEAKKKDRCAVAGTLVCRKIFKTGKTWL